MVSAAIRACSDRVVAVEIVPVAAPALVARLGAPAAPAELTRWPHVHDADRKGWHLWFQAQGIDEIGPPRGPSFDDSGLLLKAVLAGQGAGLLPAAMVALELAEGRLVKLADVVLLDDFAYYLVCPQASRERPKVAAFRAWILAAAACDGFAADRPIRRSRRLSGPGASTQNKNAGVEDDDRKLKRRHSAA
jgi:LysR family glycine cleavage system transcriptional activator